MRGDTKATLIGSIVGIIAAALFFIALVVRVSANDAARIERDRTIKVECIKAGKSLIGGNCVAVTR